MFHACSTLCISIHTTPLMYQYQYQISVSVSASTLYIYEWICNSKLCMNNVLCPSLNNFLFMIILVWRRQTFCRRTDIAIANACSRVAVSLCSSIAPLQVDVVKDYVCAGDSVTAREFHRILALRRPRYVSIHYLGYFDSSSLSYVYED